MAKLCPRCGRSSNDVKFYGAFCEDCARAMLIESLPKRVRVKRCKRCKRIRAGPSFLELSNAALAVAVARFFKGYSIEVQGSSGNTIDVKLAKKTHDGNIEVSARLGIEYESTLCDACFKKAGGYYEAMLSIRGDHERASRLAESARNYFEAKGSFITRMDESDNGYDIYMPDKKLARSFLEMMHLKPSASYKLAGLKSGKKAYRNSYYLHV
ncbi:MAG: NMD3-related protein [Candidatus Micrarchaeaceae archaeon]